MTEGLNEITLFLRQQYGFGHLSIVSEKPLIIQTESGLKKIYLWGNEHLLNWHLQWRHRLLCDAFYLDRMYVTRTGKPFAMIGKMAITCHDAIHEPAERKGNEAAWAAWLGELSAKSRYPSSGRQSDLLGAASQVEEAYLQLQKRPAATDAGSIAGKCFPAALERAKQAERLAGSHRSRRLSVLAPDNLHFSQGKWLLGKLFIELGQANPAVGYEPLAGFFGSWLEDSGKESLRSLLTYLKNGEYMDEATAELIRAELYYPREWLFLVQALPVLENGRTGEVVETFKKKWDRSSRTVTIFESVFGSHARFQEGGE